MNGLKRTSMPENVGPIKSLKAMSLHTDVDHRVNGGRRVLNLSPGNFHKKKKKQSCVITCVKAKKNTEFTKYLCTPGNHV